MFTNQSVSVFLDFKNKMFGTIQNTKVAAFMADSLILRHIDVICFVLLLLTLAATAFLSSGYIGFFAVCFCVANFFKLVVKKGEVFKMSKMDVFITLFFMFIVVSLFGSTLFTLSFHGFLKTLIYIMFYFFAGYFFSSNKDKILPTVFVIAVLVSFESVVAIIQNYSRVEAISGWSDSSYLSDVDEIINRAYGTLQPYNPNLLAGYLVAGFSSIFTLGIVALAKKNKKRFIFCTVFFVLAILAIIYTGCRGAYLGLIAFFSLLFWGIVYFIKKYMGGFSHIKKRYKNLAAFIGAGILAFIFLTPSVLKRFTSIFAMREDSSISFRMNVYEASWRMFLDNFWFGIGVGNQNFREIYGLYMKTGFDALGSYCVPLEIAVESGIFALIFFFLFIGYAIFKALKIMKSGDYPLNTRILAFMAALTIFATMAHGLFDTVWFRPQVQIIFWLNIAILNTFLVSTGLKRIK